MAAVGAAAMAQAAQSVADVTMTNAAAKMVDIAQTIAKMDKKGRDYALQLI